MQVTYFHISDIFKETITVNKENILKNINKFIDNKKNKYKNRQIQIKLNGSYCEHFIIGNDIFKESDSTKEFSINKFGY